MVLSRRNLSVADPFPSLDDVARALAITPRASENGAYVDDEPSVIVVDDEPSVIVCCLRAAKKCLYVSVLPTMVRLSA